MEKDGELSGEGNSYTTQFRQYDPRLGRWKSIDPLMFEFPWMSPYVAFNNNPVYFIDPLGLSSVQNKGGGKKAKHVKVNKSKAKSKAAEAEKGNNDCFGEPAKDGDPVMPGAGNGPQGEPAINGGKYNGDGSISGGKPVCMGCGSNGEDTWGIPGGEPSSPSSGIANGNEGGLGNLLQNYQQNKLHTTGITMKDFSSDVLHKISDINWKNALDKAKTAVDIGENGLAATQIGMSIYRQSLPLAKKIGTFSRFTIRYHRIGFARNILGRVALPLTGLEIGFDYFAMQNNQMSLKRFTWHTTGILASTAAAAAIGFEYGGPWGSVAGTGVGLLFWDGEQIYDILKESVNKIINGFENYQNNIMAGGI